MSRMDKQPNRGLGTVFASVFALLGLFRLYSFAQTGLPADALSGIGLLALAAGYFMGGTLAGTARGERARDRRVVRCTGQFVPVQKRGGTTFNDTLGSVKCGRTGERTCTCSLPVRCGSVPFA
jgi:hypothetical protein